MALNKTFWDDKVRELVAYILKNYPHTRDCDIRLSHHYWRMELEHKHGLDVYQMSLIDFFKMRAKGQIKSEDLISRARRRLQEQHKGLRGQKWEERQTKRQAEAIKQIKSL